MKSVLALKIGLVSQLSHSFLSKFRGCGRSEAASLSGTTVFRCDVPVERCGRNSRVVEQFITGHIVRTFAEKAASRSGHTRAQSAVL